ncbi:MAG TPA: SRPBCC family protein [Streptosporangiaceae bacterium]|nr:SRPBCC family protein [Streptosporangiaceae bacterium]
MQLTSAIRISRPAPEVLDALLDAGKVAACLPGSRLTGEVADGTYAGEIRLRIGPVHAVYAGTVHLDAADRAAGTAILHASGRDRGGQGSADANVTLRVEPRGASTRVLISADLVIRGTVAQYAPGAIGDVGQRLVEQFAGNVEQLLAAQAGSGANPAADRPGAPPTAGRKRAVTAAALLAAGVLAAGVLAARAACRRRTTPSLSPDIPIRAAAMVTSGWPRSPSS